MVSPSPSAQVYRVVKVSMIVELLAEKGIAVEHTLAGTGISADALHSPQARVSINQVIACYRNAMRLSRDPEFANRAGQKFHLSTYGLYGFAMLSSPDFRDTLRFAVRYHRLATPLSEISTGEDRDHAWWDVVPLAHPLVDVDLYRFMVELHFGTLTTLHRDFMGASFAPTEVHVTYGGPENAADYPAMVCFSQPRNLFIFDSAWLDRPAELGNRLIFGEIVALCDALLKELDCREGMTGKVRRALLARSCCSASFEDISRDLSLSPRTLRRRLREENTSFRKLLDELRAEMAIKYLRETDLSMDEIASTLGFSELAAFRHAFRRWTKAAPSRFRDLRSDATSVRSTILPA